MKSSQKTNVPPSMWKSLLDSWHSLLGSGDYLESLSPEQIAQFSPSRIRDLHDKVNNLDIQGVSLWTQSQFEALDADQLSHLEDTLLPLALEHASSTIIRHWVQEGHGHRFYEQLRDILAAAESESALQEAFVEGLVKRTDYRVVSEILWTVVKYATDPFFAKVILRLSDETIQRCVSEQIHANLLLDPLFRQRFKRDLARFVNAKLDYENLDKIHRDAVEELATFEQRLELSHSVPVRERIYAEMGEWLHELPVRGLGRVLWSPYKLFKLARGEQNSAIRSICRSLRRAIGQSRRALVSDRQILWMPPEGLRKEQQHVKKLFGEVHQEQRRHANKLRLLEDDLRPYAKHLQRNDLDSEMITKIDALIVNMEKEIDALQEIIHDLSHGASQVGVLCHAVENCMHGVRLEEEDGQYIGALPLELYFRLHTVLFPEDDLKRLRSLISEHESLTNFQPHFVMYEELHLLLGRIEDLQRRLSSPNSLTERCQKKVQAWRELRKQGVWMNTQDDK